MPVPESPHSGSTFEDLLAVVRLLRDPGGCPWDGEQTHVSLRHHLLEETYEALEAIDSGDPDKLREELGDLLTHIAFHADMARREGGFTPEALMRSVIEKLVRRHPHVFADAAKLGTAGQVVEQWESIKRKEGGRDSVTSGIPAEMPALAYAAVLQSRSGRAGLKWEGEPSFRAADTESTPPEIEAHAGAYLWHAVQKLRDAGVDPETALRATAVRFRDRVRRAEAQNGGRPITDLSPDERERIWNETP